MLLHSESGGGKLRFQLQKRYRFVQWFNARQAIVGLVKKKPATFWKMSDRFSARGIHSVAERTTICGSFNHDKIVGRMIFAPRSKKLDTAIVRASFENNGGGSKTRAA